MKEAEIKINIKKTAIKYGSIAGTLVVFFVILNVYVSGMQEDFRRIKNRVSSLNSEITNKNRSYNAAEGSMEKFLAIPSHRLPTESGFKESYQRIKEVLPKIEKLKESYYFKKLTFTLGKVEEDNQLSKGNFKAYSGSLSLYFEGVSDQFVFSFMNDLDNMLPGYLILSDFVVSKKDDLNNDTARSFLTTKNFHFVSGKIDYNWITFMSKKEDNAVNE